MKVELNLSKIEDSDFPYNFNSLNGEKLISLIPIGKSGIHIKEKNKGTFTSYCGGKVTDECIQRGKNSPDPAIRKKATFAANSRKWKHQEGGTLISYEDSSDISDLFLKNSKYNFQTKPSDSNYIDTDNTYFPRLKPQTKKIISEDPIISSNIFIDNNISEEAPPLSSELRNSINANLGKQGSWGHYDCSNFVYQCLRGAGIKIDGYNCRDLYKNTERISKTDIKPGDLVFLQNTQPDRFRPGIASHVAIVTDTSRIAEGRVKVASGSPGRLTKEHDMNLSSAKYLGAGRVKTGGYGMKFSYGGNFIPGINTASLKKLFLKNNTYNSDSPITSQNANAFEDKDLSPYETINFSDKTKKDEEREDVEKRENFVKRNEELGKGLLTQTSMITSINPDDINLGQVSAQITPQSISRAGNVDQTQKKAARAELIKWYADRGTFIREDAIPLLQAINMI